MNIAILFDWHHPQFANTNYSDKIRGNILSNGVLQRGNRHLKISLGDVRLDARTQRDLLEFSEALYFWHPWQRLYPEKLRNKYLSQTVFAWVIKNVTVGIAEELHKNLSDDESYLGMHGVDFSFQGHLAIYRNSLIPKYRIVSKTCYLFFSMGEKENKFDLEVSEMKPFGFADVIWEDYGARQTIFDDFDTLEHFKQVKEFQEIISPHLSGKDDEAGDLTLLIEDTNPKLFNVLGAAVRSLARAQNEEDYAQVGLSARRYFEQLADTLFPARESLYNGRKVTKAEYRNRIWAYIADALKANSNLKNQEVQTLGKEVDRLVEIANSALHGEQNKGTIMQCLVDTAKLSAVLLNITPISSRDPYYPFYGNLIKFANDLISRSKQL